MHPVVARVVAVAALATSIWAAAPERAQAHDSVAPAGAEHDWLPAEEWVFRHWIPFDVSRLQQVLRLPGRDLDAYLFNDHRTLRVLTQGHLTPHVLLHSFHTMGAEAAAATSLRESRRRFRRLRMRGLSALNIARRRGVPLTRVRAGMLELFRGHHDACWPKFPEAIRNQVGNHVLGCVGTGVDGHTIVLRRGGGRDRGHRS